MPKILVIHNDNEHSLPYVARVLSRAMCVNGITALSITCQIHERGEAIIEVHDDESAKLVSEKIAAFGRDILLKQSTGPLRVTFEETAQDFESAGVISKSGFRASELTQTLAQKLTREIRGEIRASDRSAFFVNAVALLTAVGVYLTTQRFKLDVRTDSVLRGVGKAIALVFVVWSGVIFIKGRRRRINSGEQEIVAVVALMLIELLWVHAHF